MPPRAFLFDAYGTLFDVNSIVPPGCFGLAVDPRTLSQVWRRKQLEYTWLRALMGRYEDFWRITEAALGAALRELSVPVSDEQKKLFMDGWLAPPVFADAAAALENLRGSPLAILSNGSPAMLDAALSHTGLKPYFAEVISVDGLETYKPSPLVYALGPRALQLPAEEILFVSSNWWDAAGAKAFGYRVCWVNRGGAPVQDLGFAPDRIVDRLDRIPPVHVAA